MRCLLVVNGGWDIRIVPTRPDETAGTINNNNNMVDCAIFLGGDVRNICRNTKKGYVIFLRSFLYGRISLMAG